MRRDPSLAERDARVARLGEAALRLMAGTVGDATLERARATVAASPDVYPWEAVVDELLAEPVEPSALFQDGLIAQRDWLARGGPPRAEARPAAAPLPRAVGRRAGSRSVGFHFKTFVAILIVRGAFYAIMAGALLVALVLLRARYPEFDIYLLAERFVGWLKSLLQG